MISIEEIKENYKKFSDSKIENIALSESKELRKEVLSILKDEILKRKLDPNLVTWVDAETNTLTDFEKQSIKTKIENLKCPNCELKRSELKGWEINTVASFLITFRDSSNNRILCHYCGRNKKIISFLVTLIAGWWSRRGILRTPYILFKDIVNLFYQRKISDKIIDELINVNNGMLKLGGTDSEQLVELVQWHNLDYLTLEIEDNEKPDNKRDESKKS